MHWRIEEKLLPLKYSWKISRNTSDYKTNLFIYAGDEKCFGIGEAAPNVRYGESPESLLMEFEKLRNFLPKNADTDIYGFAGFLKENNISNALRFGIESAYIHFICHKKDISVQQFLGLPKAEKVVTSYSLPIMPISDLGDFIKQNHLQRFPYIKVKINKEEGTEILNEVAKYIQKPLLIDANESFTDVDDLLNFSENINHLPVLMLEQPMPAALAEEYKYLKINSKILVFADESMTDNEDISALAAQFHGVNMKLMKAGSYITGIRQLKMAKELGLQTMIGCMVETSIGISSAIHVAGLAKYADLDGFLILKEDPFGLVAEQQGFLQKV